MKKINTGVLRYQKKFPKKFILSSKTFNLDTFQITEKKQQIKNNNFMTNI